MSGPLNNAELGFTICRRINSPPAEVFRIFTDLDRAAERIPAISKVELLTDGPIKQGTRFLETRRVRGREVAAELEFVRYEQDQGYVVRCVSQGCAFTSAFLMWPDGDGTKVEVALDCDPKGLLKRMRVRLLLPAMKKEFMRDFLALKAVAEQGWPP